MSSPDEQAFAAMVNHHRFMVNEMRAHVSSLTDGSGRGSLGDKSSSELVSYLTNEVLPHAIAEEHSIYQAAADLPSLSATVSSMIQEHEMLASLTAKLATKDDSAVQEIASLATEIYSLFVTHVAKENDIVLPALLAHHQVELSQLLQQMREQLLVAEHHGSRSGSIPEEDHGGPSEISDTAHGDTDEATGSDLDVRPLAPAKRHEMIFATFAALEPGNSFVLVNDHDPKPLRYQFEAEHSNEFTWDYLEAGPKIWRVAIQRIESA